MDPEQSAEKLAVYPDGPVSVTLYAPASSVTWVPGASAPAKLSGESLAPPESRLKLAAVAVPPLSLTTCLMTISFAAWSLLVTVQVLVWPLAMEPEQSAEKLAVYPDGPVSVTL